MMQPIKTDSWTKLVKRAQTAVLAKLNSPHRAIFSTATADITLDYSDQLIDESIKQDLLDLAQECNLKKNIQALFSGKLLNTTESKPALHTALRTFRDDPILVDSVNILPDVLKAREQMRAISDKIRCGEWLGYSGKPITDVVNIGIGGSQLGPFFCINALEDWTLKSLNFHFISDFDPNGFKRVTARLNPETTLFIVSSKSLTTRETIFNAKKALMWIGASKQWDKHVIAVTANTKRAKELGIKTIVPIWEWVGGRFSLCSAINLITCIAIGFTHFSEMLQGAHLMDEHFYSADFEANMPVLLALLGIWNINFLSINNLLVLTYSQDLQYLVPYLQQLDMESNGKSLDKNGKHVDYATGPIVWGGLGNQAQHSYYQLLSQGTHKTAIDFISLDAFNEEAINQVCLAQKTVLAQGVSESNNPYGLIRGSTPLNHIRLKECSPKTIGALVALYEHKIFTQGVIWNINSFDQPGVESSKRLIKDNAYCV